MNCSRAFLTVGFLLTPSFALGASNIFRAGNQFPSGCGTAGLFLQANGDCTTSWVSNAVPADTAKTDVDNNWSSAQTSASSWTFHGNVFIGGNGTNLAIADQNGTSAKWYMEPGGATMDWQSVAGNVADIWFKADLMTLHFGSSYDAGIGRTGPAAMSVNDGATGIGTWEAALPSLTKAQIQAKTVSRVGVGYYCSDCATVAVCISTGTTVGSFGLMTNKASACQ